MSWRVVGSRDAPRTVVRSVTSTTHVTGPPVSTSSQPAKRSFPSEAQSLPVIHYVRDERGGSVYRLYWLDKIIRKDTGFTPKSSEGC